MGLGGASRNNANDFLVVFLLKGMDNQENRARSYGSDCDPAFLIVTSVVAVRNSIRIVENENGSFKADIVLAKILPALFLIPFNSIADRD